MTPEQIDCRRHAHFSLDRPPGYRGRHIRPSRVWAAIKKFFSNERHIAQIDVRR